MEFKNVHISDSVSVPVPIGLSKDEEASFIANRLAFVNLEDLEKQCMAAIRQQEKGETVSLRSILEELESENSDNGSAQ